MIRPSKLNAGSVDYYESSVERQPVEVGTDMTDYYSEHGDRPPSVFVVGRDAEAVQATAERLSVQAGQELDRDQVEAWFNECQGPSGEQLGQPYKAPSVRAVKVKDEHGKPVLDEQGQQVTKAQRVGGSVRGWDLTTAAPKSVSMLWGLGNDAQREAIERAHLAASTTALDYLSQHAGYTRQRMPGYDQPVIVEGLAVAGVRYQHRTSRAMEPHLHDHVLVHNRVLNSVTGDWTSLDGTAVMHECKTAGSIYQAALRSQLSAELGVSWQAVDPHAGTADMVGLDRATIEAWSTRTTEIDAWMSERGLSGAGADTAAQKETREAKDLTRSDDQLRMEWGERARAEGLNVAAIGHQVEPGGDDQAAQLPGVMPTTTQILAEASRARSTFTRAQLAGTVAAMLPPDVAPADVLSTIEQLTDEALDQAVRLEGTAAQGDDVSRRASDGRLFGTREGAVRFAARETIQLEVTATQRAGQRVEGLASDPAGVSAASGLSVDQLAGMRQLVGSDRRASVLIAPAGAGKTTSLQEARKAWEASGHTVRGIAPTGKAAAGMVDEGAASAADTIATVLGRVRRGQGSGWSAGDVVLVDEAGMVGSLTLAQLIEQAEQAQARLLLIGDPEQLQPVGEAAGLFELLADDLPDTVRLAEVWRQVDEHERTATLGLRGDASDREADRAVAWYHVSQRLRGGDVGTMLDDMLTDWTAATDRGRDAVMLVPDWTRADALAVSAQAHELAMGRVSHDQTVPVGEVDDEGRARGPQRHAGVGDLVMTRANDYQLRTSTGGSVRNGQTWRVARINKGGDRVQLARTGKGMDEHVEVPAAYLSAHARLGYAISIHQSQGATVDVALSMLDASVTGQNEVYTAMTRGREDNQAYIAAERGEKSEIREEHAHGAASRFRLDEDEATDLFSDMLKRGRRDRAAHHVLDDQDASANVSQTARFDPETVDEFDEAAQFTAAARTQLSRSQRLEQLRNQPPPAGSPERGYGR